jgi:hypothetical protein
VLVLADHKLNILEYFVYTPASDKNFVLPEVKCQQIKNVLKLSDFSSIGESVEVTRSIDKVSVQPHLHILALVKPSYLNDYLSHTKWVNL